MSSRRPSAAQRFRELHGSGLLVLPNAWDAGSARLIESLGAKAVATSSAAVAWAHGYPDGDLLPVARVVETTASIARVLQVPLSVDVEGGYSDDPHAVGVVVERVIDAGAVGINLEDGGGDPAALCAKIEAARGAAARTGVDLFVNARTDVYLRGLAPGEARVEATLVRAARYRAAGADGIFVPGVVAAEEIAALVAGLGLPLNVMALAPLPPSAQLEALGVQRLSAGAALAEVLYGRIAALAGDFLREGVSATMLEGAMDYGAINALMPRD
jgi:2-methylisocitrate lyase-like PEP mutase family enzyme